MSRDSDLSASELRQRYLPGGTASDDSLSASQLRARHGVASNSADFSTGEAGTNPMIMIIVVLLVIALVFGGGWLLSQGTASAS